MTTMKRLGRASVLLAVVLALGIGFIAGKWQVHTWPDSIVTVAVDAFHRCTSGGRDCGYYPSQNVPGVLETPPSIEARRGCKRQVMRADITQEYARVIIRCTAGELVGEFVITLPKSGLHDWRDPIVSFAFAQSNETVQRSELGDLVGPVTLVP